MTTLTMPELTEVEGKITKLAKDLADIFGEAKGDNNELDLTKVKCVGGTTAEKAAHMKALNDEMTDLGVKRDELREILKAAEFADRDDLGEPGDGRTAPTAKSWIDHITKSGVFDLANKGTSFDVDEVDLKAVFSTGAGWAPAAPRAPGYIESAQRRPVGVIDLIPSAPTSTPAGTYMEETTFTNTAAETAEGDAKPEATLVLTERSWQARKIPVILPVTDEQIEDVEGVQAYVENRLPFMVRQRLSGQILVGNGTAPNLRGVLNVVGIQTQAKGADPTPDAVYKAMVKIMTTGQAFPTGVAFNPLDWQDVRLLRTNDGIYIWGNPSEAGPERIWGLDVRLDQALTENTAVVADWSMTELKIRKGLTVEVGYNADDWSKNKQTFRAETRVAFIVYRPAAVCSVTGV